MLSVIDQNNKKDSNPGIEKNVYIILKKMRVCEDFKNVFHYQKNINNTKIIIPVI